MKTTSLELSKQLRDEGAKQDQDRTHEALKLVEAFLSDKNKYIEKLEKVDTLEAKLAKTKNELSDAHLTIERMKRPQ